MSLFNLNAADLHYRTVTLKTNLSIYELFLRAYGQSQNLCYLESLGEYSDFSPYSILYFDPIHHLEARAGQLTLDGKPVACQNPFDALRDLSRLKIDAPGYCGGLYGYLGYEGAAYLDDIPGMKTGSPFPDFEFGLYLDGVVFDKRTGSLDYFYLTEDRSSRIQALAELPFVMPPFNFEELGPDMSQAEYERNFERCKEHIAWGDIFQVILSIQFHYKLSGKPLCVYDQLRSINPSPYLSYLKFGQREIITSSVDLVTRVRKQAGEKRTIENFALAGTTLRGKTPTEDATLFEAMTQDTKERAEHMMLVDLSRNDVGRVSEFGSVQVAEFMVPKRFSHVQHIESKIVGTVRDDKDVFDCVAATAPMGTVTGAPKIEAMKIINHLEKNPRGPYSGCLGGFGLNGECILSVGVRSLFASGRHGYVQVGSGIVQDSTVEYEYRELRRKSRGIRAAMGGVVEND